MGTPSVISLSTKGDNYIYLISNGTEAAVVDPGDADTVIPALQQRGLTPIAILLTHHHSDHVGGVNRLRSRYDLQRVYGPRDHRIHGHIECVREGENIDFAGISLQVLEVPGHTTTHLAFYSEQLGAVFTGDTLFSAGCGRLLGGSAAQLYHSLQKLSALPEETIVYGGHEYTLDNLRFALSIDTNNPALRKRFEEVLGLRMRNCAPEAKSIAVEKATNPFLRVTEPTLRAALGMEDAAAEEVFAHLRRKKDAF
jgi:hydroxyacylglutathione hydrolase